MSDFTKGHWEFNYADGSIKPGPNCIGYVEVNDWHKLGMGEANAHLIAAAPDMYDALDAILESYQGQEYLKTNHYEAAKLALAKARGET